MHMPARSHGLIFPAPDPSSSGRVVAVFNVGIALLLMELGVYRVFEDIGHLCGGGHIGLAAWLPISP